MGESRLTKGYALPARHVIHTVGPVWLGGASDEVETLRRAVTSALDIARDMKFETVAFCCISRGIHRFLWTSPRRPRSRRCLRTILRAA